MELEKLNLYRDTSWNDIKLRFCGHSECLPLHSYGPGTRPYYLMHFVLSGKGRLVVNKTEYLIEEKQIFLIEPDQMVFYQADKENPWTYSWVGFNGKLAPYFMHRLGFGYPSLTKGLSTEVFEEIKDLLEILISIKNDSTKNDLYTNGILLLLLSKVGTFIENSKELPERKSRQNSESHVQQAISIVEDFYGRGLTVQYIADKLNLNRSYLSEIFSKQMGVPLKKYWIFASPRVKNFFLLLTGPWTISVRSVDSVRLLIFQKYLKNTTEFLLQNIEKTVTNANAKLFW